VSSNALLDATALRSSAGVSADLHFPGSALARFLELRGHCIVKGCGALWYAGPGRFLVSLPYQALLNPNPMELRRMLRETRSIGARFPSASWTGVESGLYVMRTRDYALDSLHEEHRRRVRHGLECFHVRPATKTQLLNHGRLLNLECMARRGRYNPEFGDRRRWETLIEAAFTCSDIAFPAIFNGPRLAAYMITCREQRWLHILHQMSREEDLPNFADYVLTYTATQQAAGDPTLDAISYGSVPLCGAGRRHDHKLGFGYEMVPHKSAIHLHPVLDRVLNWRVARAAVRAARTLCQEHKRLQTIETVLEGARSSGPLA